MLFRSASTYHNTVEGWYLMLPDAWEGKLSVRQVIGVDERGTVFSFRDSARDTPVDFLGVYTITGSSREYKAVRSGRFVLKRQSGTIYAAVLFEEGADWSGAINQEELNQRFRLITREWTAGVN